MTTADAVAGVPPGAAEPAGPAAPATLVDAWAAAGILESVDRQVAGLLVRHVEPLDPLVAFAAALAVRAQRMGDVGVDLDRLDELVARAADRLTDPGAPGWPPGGPDLALGAISDVVASNGTGLVIPEGALVRAALRAAPTLVRSVDEAAAADPAAAGRDHRPLVLVGSRVLTQRQHVDETTVADGLRRLVATPVAPPTDTALAAVSLLVPDGADDAQRAAVVAVLTRSLAVITGGPGTGKTHTLAAALTALTAGDVVSPASVAVVAPTGKAASRVGEAIAAFGDRARTLGLPAFEVEPTTIHRLLGSAPGRRTRFAHGPDRRLPHDLVVVDETSMVALPLMARLLEALRDDARLVLVGDPGQLESVESGSVLGDLVHAGGAPQSPFAGAVAVLATSHRVEPASRGIPALARAVTAGDADGAMAVLAAGEGGVRWIDTGDPWSHAVDVLAPVLEGYEAAVAAAAGTRPGGAAEALGRAASVRLLCGHRWGPFGVARWNDEIAQRLGNTPQTSWAPGRLLLVTRNDPRTGLANGDTGIVVAAASELSVVDGFDDGFASSPSVPALVDDRTGEARAVFARPGGLRAFAPTQLPPVETAFAMTVHKSQGSEYPVVVLVVPPVGSPLLTRELLYTAVTRAKVRVVVVGAEAALREAIGRPSARTSGLTRALLAAEATEAASAQGSLFD